MRVKSSVRRSASARLAAARSSRSANLHLRFQPLGGSSSGRTADSDSANLGSNPSPPAKLQGPLMRALSFLGLPIVGAMSGRGANCPTPEEGGIPSRDSEQHGCCDGSLQGWIYDVPGRVFPLPPASTLVVRAFRRFLDCDRRMGETIRL